jgi:hypothetical protein
MLNLQNEHLAIILGISLSASTNAHAQAVAVNGCPSVAAETRLKQRETALLGPAHAEDHAKVRAHRCRVAQGLEKVAKPEPQMLAAFAAKPSSAVGQWSAPFGIPVVGIISVLLNTGKVLFWSYDPSQWYNPNASNTGVGYVWDPATRTGHAITPPENIWCGGQTILGDGRVYVAGGNLRYPDPSAGKGWEGSLSNYTFNPNTETWTKQPDMANGRWYPTVTQVNGVVITSGYDQTGSQAIVQAVELFRASPNIDGVGSVNTVSFHDPTGLYPFQYLLRSGQMLQAGPSYANSALLTPVPPGATWSWSNLPAMRSSHMNFGNGIIYTEAATSVTPVKQAIVIAGGEDDAYRPISNNEWLDGANPTAGWSQYPQWLQARHNGNTVILPDGRLFTVGGNSASTLYDNPLFESELYNKPADDPTGSWVQMAPNTIPAAYHSSAILLPDATVLLSQDDMDKADASAHQAQVYSPPYLFAGARPEITEAPSALSIGQSFSVTASTPNIASVVLIAPGAVTHGNDMHQRFLKLKSQTNGPNLQVSMPTNKYLAPPGYYMLFIVDSKGIPSVAKFVHVSWS